MKILVISDIHNKKGVVKRIVNKTNPDKIFFLGDGIDVVIEELKDKDLDKLTLVKGNTDIGFNLPLRKKVTVGEVSILLVHGHKLSVKQGLLKLYEVAKSQNVNLVCFGHTHKPYAEYINDILFFNPGTLGSSRGKENTYGVLEIDNKKISQKIEKI